MSRKASRRKKTRASGGWFDHRGLLLVEAVLLIGLFEEMLQAWLLTRDGLPPLLRIAAGMALSLTVLGGVAMLVRKRLTAGLDATQKAVRRLPVPVPQLAVHLGLLGLIFLAYAAFWDDDTGAVGALVRLAGQARAGVTEALASP